MLYITILVCLISVATTGNYRYKCPESFPERIINGENAKQGEFPYMVTLKSDDIHICGGSILNKCTILTAAHCLFHPLKINKIVAGERNLNKKGQGYRVAAAIINKKFSEDDGNHYNDIAVIKTSKNIQFNNLIQPIKLPSSKQESFVGYNSILTGWGYVQPYSTVIKPILQKAKLSVLYPKVCVMRLGPRAARSYDKTVNLCAGNHKGRQGGCMGDSGGPLVVNGVQIGIVSWGKESCKTNSPTVFTKVTNYLNWIKNHMDCRS